MCVCEGCCWAVSALNLEGPEGESESDVGIVHTNTGLETLTWSCIRSGINSSKTNSVNEIPPACYENVYSQRDRRVSGWECYHLRHVVLRVLFVLFFFPLIFFFFSFYLFLLPLYHFLFSNFVFFFFCIHIFSPFFSSVLFFFFFFGFLIWFNVIVFFCSDMCYLSWLVITAPSLYLSCFHVVPPQAVHESRGAQWVLEEGPVHCW